MSPAFCALCFLEQGSDPAVAAQGERMKEEGAGEGGDPEHQGEEEQRASERTHHRPDGPEHDSQEASRSRARAFLPLFFEEEGNAAGGIFLECLQATRSGFEVLKRFHESTA